MLSEHELRQIAHKGDVSQELLNKLAPYFAELKSNIHQKWEAISLEDGQSAKLLKFQLKTVVALEEAIVRDVNKGKQSRHKIKEARNGNDGSR